MQQIFVCYLCILVYVVFLTPNRFTRRTRALDYQPIISTLKRFYGRGNEHFWPYYIGYWGNIFGNIVLFVPFGFLIKKIFPTKSNTSILIVSLAASVLIELIQYIFILGMSDIDDVILNITGAAIGLWLANQKIFFKKND